MENLYDSDWLLLLRLVAAHIIADFWFQPKKWVDDKNSNGGTSIWLYVHGLVVGVLTYFLIPGWLGYKEAAAISIIHVAIDYGKIKIGRDRKVRAFIIDQLLHLVTIIFLWCVMIGKWYSCLELWLSLTRDIRYSGIALAYMICTMPLGYLIGIILDKANLHGSPNASPIQHPNTATQHSSDNNGMMIGVFERMIILTFVLLGQYEAIGFLITGKSILRFQRDEVSEYIVMGTMLSYALSIAVGVITNLMLN